MHLVRRAALRAATTVAKPRTITSISTPFVLRAQKSNVIIPTVMRRFASDEPNGVESAVQSAIESAEQPRSSYGFNGGAAAGEQFGGKQQFDLVPTNGIYIGNLLFDITVEDLQKEFAPYNPVKATIATDQRGMSKGFGYIEFETTEDATSAIAAKNQATLQGRTMVVNYISRTKREPSKNPPSKTLFVGNLAFELTDADLNKLFRDCRNVLDVRVAIDRRTGQPRGFAHADFLDVESCVAAKEFLEGKQLYNRTLRLDFSLGRSDSKFGSPNDQGERRDRRNQRDSRL